MAYKGRAGGRSYIAQKSRNSIAVVWIMRIGGGKKGMMDSCTHQKRGETRAANNRDALGRAAAAGTLRVRVRVSPSVEWNRKLPMRWFEHQTPNLTTTKSYLAQHVNT